MSDDFEHLYRQYSDTIVHYCHRRLSADDARDAAQDVFLFVYANWHKVPANEAHRLPWLYSVARGIVANRMRARARLGRLKMKIAGLRSQFVDDIAEIVLGNETLRSYLAAAEARDGEELYLLQLVIAGLPHREIGDALGISAGATATRIHRLRKALRSNE